MPHTPRQQHSVINRYPGQLPSTPAQMLPDPWHSCSQAGVDEVGIGPLAGPVVAAAVLLDVNRPIEGLTDSKKLTAARRAKLAEQIYAQSLCWAVGWADEKEIDELNILRASHVAMQRAVAQLTVEPAIIMVDGNKTPGFRQPCIAVVKGDLRVPAISAASIIAKVHRDAHMARLDDQYPGYGFARHMGYPTRAHFNALQTLGVTPVHRYSFAPVRKACNQPGVVSAAASDLQHRATTGARAAAGTSAATDIRAAAGPGVTAQPAGQVPA